jgi:iron(III) transport system ATP-binding protein
MIPLRLEHISKRFGPVAAVRDVSLAVEPGELFFLLGPSGCGKTTLLRIIAGFYEPDAGSVYFGDADVTRRPAYRRNCGMVFQNYALWPHMTVLENVAFGLTVRGIARPERRRQAMEMLTVVEMADLAKRKPTQLSGGQQQRVALARALAIRPDFLLLDEPLSNLDAKLRLQMRTEIRRIQQATHVTSVYVTHDQDEALAMADRLAVVRDGRIEALGPPRSLYLDPPSAWVAGFLGATNLLEGQLRDLTPSGTGASDGGRGATIVTDFGNLAAARVPADLAAGAAVAISIRPETIRLLAVTGPAPDRNVFDVTVAARTFQGETEQVRVRLGSREVTISDRPTSLPPVGVGAAARIFVAPEAMRVFATQGRHI